MTQYYAPEIGAPQLRLRMLAQHLVKLGHQVEVVTAMPNYPTGRIFPGYRGKLYCREQLDGITVHRVWGYPATGRGAGRALNYGSFMLAALLGLARARPADYLFVESPPLLLALTAYAGAACRGMRIIFNVADLWPDTLKEMGFINDGLPLRLLLRLERWAYGTARYVNAVTRDWEHRLLHEKSLPREKVLFLPNGVDAKLFRPLPYDMALARFLGVESRMVILYTGTHGYVHRIDVALRAAQLVSDPAVLFLFVGDGSDKPRLQRMAREMGLGNVRFLDAVPAERISSYYSIAAAGLSTIGSFSVTRPVKMFTVMACGKPLLYSGQGEGAEIVRQAKAGIVVPPEDPAALARAVLEIAGDGRSAAVMGGNGRRYVKQHVDWGSIIGEWTRQLEVPGNAFQH